MERGFVEGPVGNLPREKLAGYDTNRQSKVWYRRIDDDSMVYVNHGILDL